MNVLRITLNIALFGVLLAASAHLLFVDFYALGDMLYTGWARYLLASSLLLMAGFVGMITQGWIRGSIPKPPKSSFRHDPTYVHPAYKGELLVRYWYFALPAFICFFLAFALAESVPSN